MENRSSLPQWFYACAAISGLGTALLAFVAGPNVLTSWLLFSLVVSAAIGCLMFVAIGKAIALLDEIAQRLAKVENVTRRGLDRLAMTPDERAEADEKEADARATRARDATTPRPRGSWTRA